MKNLIWKFLLVLFLFTNFFATPASADTIPSLEAKGVVLMDGITGYILFSKSPDVQFEPASTTKILTALITLEKTSLDDKVTIGVNPPLVDGSRIGIAEGEIYTVRELLLGLLLESGNDTAEALAEHISGSNASFGLLMTEKAKEIGAKNTTFKNPSGLHEDGHLTTAYDLALIMKEAYSNPDFNEIAKTPFYYYENHPNHDGTEKWVTNKNHCLNQETPYYYEYTYSGKVGYTPEANHTYAATAVKDSQVLISSFLNAENKDAQFLSVGPLFDYGFDNFETIKVLSKGDKVSEYNINDETIIPLLSSKDFYYSKSKADNTPTLTFTYKDRDLSKETIYNGQALFTGNILLNGEPYGDLEFISSVDREYTFKVVINESIEKLKQNTLSIIVLSLISLLLLFLLFTNLKRRRHSRKLKCPRIY